MIDPEKTYVVSVPNIVGIYAIEFKSGKAILKSLALNEYSKGTRIFELGEEYKVVLNSSLTKSEV